MEFIMPKASLELTARREKEIVDACEKIYRAKGFYGVTIKEISTETSFTRPAIYNYFETKDEILLALLIREYEKMCEGLKEVKERAALFEKKELAEALAQVLEERELLLRIQSMDLFQIEINSRIERLADFKKRYRCASDTLEEILRLYSSSASAQERRDCCMTFFAFMFGIYPFAFHTEKQRKAMKMAGMPNRETSIYKMVYNCLMKLLPERK